MSSPLLVKDGLTGSLYRILGIAVILGSFLVFVWVFGDAIRSAGGLKPDRWVPFIGAAILHLLMLFFLMVIWERVLAFLRPPKNGSVIPSKSSLYIAYSRSWLARYIPGRIWSLAGRTILVNRLGVPADQVARSIVIEVVLAYGMLTLISGSVLSWVYFHPAISIVMFTIGVIFFATSLITIEKLSSRVPSQTTQVPFPVRTFRRVVRSFYGRSCLSRTLTIKGIVIYGVYSCMQLAFIVLIAASFTELDFTKSVVIAGAWGLSLSVGWLSIFPPVGLGARDGLAFLLFSQVIDLPAASSIVVASRLVMVMTDFAFVVALEGISNRYIRYSHIGYSIKSRFATAINPKL